MNKPHITTASLSARILADAEAVSGLAAVVKPFGAHPATAQRWCSRGCKSAAGQLVRLEHVRVGAKIKTSAEAVARFFAALSDADQGGADLPPAPTPAERRKAAEAADKALRAMGA